MGNRAEKKLRFADAVYASGASAKQIRHWLRLGQVELRASVTDSGWTEFSIVDVIVLGIVRRLVECGLPVDRAGEIARDIVVGTSTVLLKIKKLDPDSIVRTFSSARLIVWHDREWRYRVDYSGTSCALPADAFVVVVLDVAIGEIIRRAYQPDGESGIARALVDLTIRIEDATDAINRRRTMPSAPDQ